MANVSNAVLKWISGNDTGISSMAIWRHMTGLSPDGYCQSPPIDPDDFGRCYRLLRAVPEWRSRIGEMATHEGWEGLAAEWADLEAMYEEAMYESEVDRRGPAAHRQRA